MEKDLVDFGHGRTFDRVYLEHHSRLYKHLSEVEPSIVIRKIDMPNLLGKFSQDTFDDLHDFINKGYVPYRGDIEKQLEDTFQLMLALDMPSIINLAVNKCGYLERKILQYDVFEACLESQHPFNLLQDMLASNEWEISSFANSKISRFIAEEEKRNRPSNKVLYIIKHRSVKHTFVLDRSDGCLPILVTVKKNEMPQPNGECHDICCWFSSSINNIDFFQTCGVEWICWISFASRPCIAMRYYSERGVIGSTTWEPEVSDRECLTLVDQSRVTSLVYIVDLYDRYTS